MKLFTPLYDWVLSWAGKKHAARYLGALSAAESVIVPVPVEALLVPMVLAQPTAWARLAALATVTSVAGGVIGYGLGVWAWDVIEPLVDPADFVAVQQWFAAYGVWVVLIAAFTPIPYKIFTVSAGFLSVSFLPFLLASALGRGARFVLVAGLVMLAGPAAEPVLRRHIETLGWAVIALFILWLIAG